MQDLGPELQEGFNSWHQPGAWSGPSITGSNPVDSRADAVCPSIRIREYRLYTLEQEAKIETETALTSATESQTLSTSKGSRRQAKTAPASSFRIAGVLVRIRQCMMLEARSTMAAVPTDVCIWTMRSDASCGQVAATWAVVTCDFLRDSKCEGN